MNQNIIETYFQKWKDQLIDLSRKNDQIYFNSLRSGLLFHQIDTSNTSQLSDLIQHFIVKEKVGSQSSTARAIIWGKTQNQGNRVQHSIIMHTSLVFCQLLAGK